MLANNIAIPFREEERDLLAITHPLIVGNQYSIWDVKLVRPSFVEGLARIIGPVPNIADFYYVQFAGERIVHRRFVHSGDFQANRHQLQSALAQYYRAPSIQASLPDDRCSAEGPALQPSFPSAENTDRGDFT